MNDEQINERLDEVFSHVQASMIRLFELVGLEISEIPPGTDVKQLLSDQIALSAHELPEEAVAEMASELSGQARMMQKMGLLWCELLEEGRAEGEIIERTATAQLAAIAGLPTSFGVPPMYDGEAFEIAQDAFRELLEHVKMLHAVYGPDALREEIG